MINRIKQAANILEVASDLTTLKRVGARYFGLCPFHSEKTASFSVQPEHGRWKCFGCGKGGDVIDLLTESGMTFREALKFLSEKTGIALDDWQGSDRWEQRDLMRVAHEVYAKASAENLKRSKEALDYLKKRGISEEVINLFNIGLGVERIEQLDKTHLTKTGLFNSSGVSPFAGRILFPFTDITGHPIGFTARKLSGVSPKYLNSKNSELFNKSRTLFGIAQARKHIRELKACRIVEGPMDALALHSHMHKHVLATCGSAFTKEHALLIRRLGAEVAVLHFDGDKAGRKSTIQAARHCMDAGLAVSAVIVPDGQDPCSQLQGIPFDEWRMPMLKAVGLEDWLEHHIRRIEDKTRQAQMLTSLSRRLGASAGAKLVLKSLGRKFGINLIPKYKADKKPTKRVERMDARLRRAIVQTIALIHAGRIDDAEEVIEFLPEKYQHILRRAGISGFDRERIALNGMIDMGAELAAKYELARPLDILRGYAPYYIAQNYNWHERMQAITEKIRL